MRSTRLPTRLRRVAIAWAGVCLGTAVAGAPLAAQSGRATALKDLSSSFEELASSVSPAVVQIFASGLSLRRNTGPTGRDVVARSASGSGVIVDPTGYIITNAHVVAGATNLRVSLPEGMEDAGGSILRPRGSLVEAELVGVDAESDLAVLKVDAVDLPWVRFGDSDQLEQGELVFAFGSPLGLENSVSMGVVSSVARQLEPDGPMIYVQTDAAVNPGNSGGPLVNTDGELVGINTLIFSRSGGSDGLSFAAPVNIVRTVYEQIRATGRVRRGTIGVRAQTVTPRVAAGLGLSRSWGVILSDVFPGGPAALAGLRAGDLVTRLDGKLLENGRQFDVNLYRYTPGSRVTIEAIRDETPVTFQVTVAERPEFEDPLAAALASGRNLVSELGIFAVDLGPVFGLMQTRSRRGVVVAALALGPLDQESAFQAGDVIYAVNKQIVGSVEELRLALSRYGRGDAVVFHVQRGRQLIYLPVDAGW